MNEISLLFLLIYFFLVSYSSWGFRVFFKKYTFSSISLFGGKTVEIIFVPSFETNKWGQKFVRYMKKKKKHKKKRKKKKKKRKEKLTTIATINLSYKRQSRTLSIIVVWVLNSLVVRTRL